MFFNLKNICFEQVEETTIGNPLSPFLTYIFTDKLQVYTI